MHVLPSLRTARIGRRDVIKEKDLKKKVDPVTPTAAAAAVTTPPVSRRRFSSGTSVGEDDQYGLSQLFQPDNVPRGSVSEENSSIRTKFKVVQLQRSSEIWFQCAHAQYRMK